CGLLLRSEHREPMILFRWFNRCFAWITRSYSEGVQLALRRTGLALMLFVAMILVTLYLFRSVPSGFIPQEDQGVMLSAVMMPNAASLYRTQDLTDRVTRLEKENGEDAQAIQDIITINGFDLLTSTSKTFSATMSFIMKHWEERTTPQSSVKGQISNLRNLTAGFQKGLVIPFNPPAIPGLGTTGGFQFYVQNRGNGGPSAMAKAIKNLIAAANKRPELTGVTT